MIENKFSDDEIKLIKTRHVTSQLFFALLFKHYKKTYCFIENFESYPKAIIDEIAQTLGVSSVFQTPSSRAYGDFCSLIRAYFSTSFVKKEHYFKLTNWIKNDLLTNKFFSKKEITEKAFSYLRAQKIEPFTDKKMQRIVNDAVNGYEKELFNSLYKNIPNETIANLNGLLLPFKDGLSYLGWINKEFNDPTLDSMLNLIDQLSLLNALKINYSNIEQQPKNRISYYANSFSRFNPSHLKEMHDIDRCSYILFYSYTRKRIIIDKIIDMFIRITGNIIFKSERRVLRKLINEVKKVYNKDSILVNIAEICLSDPDQSIRKSIFPAIGEVKLKNIIDEYKKKGSKYQNILHKQVRSSYASYYRRMILPVLENITFRSNNLEYQSILKGLSLIKKHFKSGKKYFPESEEIPLDCLPKKWQNRIVEEKTGKIRRICYEVYLLKRLGDRIKCREIWIENSFKHRNPDEDLPIKFEENKEECFNSLSLPKKSEDFITDLKNKLTKSLDKLNNNILRNSKVKISDKKNGRIIVTPLKAQKESQNLGFIKKLLQEKWQDTNLIDILKEVELDVKFTDDFVSYGEKIYLKPEEISERLLLAIYGIGTNVGLKHMRVGNPQITYSQLKHIKNYFLNADNLRNAISKISDNLFEIRFAEIWGEMPIAVGCDSVQFSAYFQNLISEFHNRYGGRGVMIYWHVEKNACCVYSQLKSVSSSEVSAMIKGVLKHCTEMSIQKSYVDTHGQSEVGFAFAHLLGFSLMPRLANLNKQKLSQCDLGDFNKYKNLKAVLTDTINWQLIQEQYNQMVKYSAAMKEGYAEPESILRRFTRNNLKHPTYLALSQLGKAIKTIFICEYLSDEGIRQEIHEGLNAVELWNSVSKFIFYGRSGEISSNHDKTQEISVLSLHLLQLSMVYVNTLMLQQILVEHNLIDKLTKEDKRALTPLIYEHINPYGLFPLDLSLRLPFLNYREAA